MNLSTNELDVLRAINWLQFEAPRPAGVHTFDTQHGDASPDYIVKAVSGVQSIKQVLGKLASRRLIEPSGAAFWEAELEYEGRRIVCDVEREARLIRFSATCDGDPVTGGDRAIGIKGRAQAVNAYRLTAEGIAELEATDGEPDTGVDQAAVAKGGDAAQEPDFKPTQADLNIMQAIRESPATVCQAEIIDKSGEGQQTVRRRLKELEREGVVHRPHGERKGYALTPPGISLLPTKKP